MKRANKGLSLLMSLLLCIVGFRFCIIANAEGTDAARTIGGDIEEVVEEQKDTEELETIDNYAATEEIEDTEDAEVDEVLLPAEETTPALDEIADNIVDTTPADANITDSEEEEVTELSEEISTENVDESDLQVKSLTVTFKVVNGFWDDGTSSDKIVTITGSDDELKLTAEQIPSVGSKPYDNTYGAGSWDKIPCVEDSITESSTYTFTYVEKKAAVVVKAPEAKILYYVSETP